MIYGKKFMCYDCRLKFKKPDVWEEWRGECFGFPSWETMSGCPRCHGEYGEEVQCEKCGKSYVEGELFFGVCEDCKEEDKEVV